MFDLNSELSARRDAGLYRTRLHAESAQGARIRYDGKDYLSFCSNDYLGLAGHPDLRGVLCDAARDWGVGAGASHLLGGHSQPHEELEIALARFIGTERALLFSTGYMANLGVLAGLTGRGDRIIQDKLNHASLIDGGQLSRAKVSRYPHVDHAAVSHMLGEGFSGKQIVASDGVFSMDGDIAPVTELLAACREHGVLCYIDDAHGMGVIGESGRGSLEACGVDPGVEENRPHLLVMGTLGKAFGNFGAFVAGSEAWIETLIQQARTYVYTTALPPAQAAVSLAALDIVQRESWRREHLAQLVCRFQSGCKERGIRMMPSNTPIQPVVIGDKQRAMEIAHQLKSQGLLVFAIRQPTVPAGTERLRITFSAAHELGDIDQLLDALQEAGL